MKKRSLKVNALINTMKTLLTLIFPLITYPYVTRILGAVNLGKVNYSNSIINYFVLLAGLGINTYAIREGGARQNNKEALLRFANEVFTINIISTCVSYALLIILYYCVPSLSEYRTLLMIQSFTIVGNTISVGWLYSIYEEYVYITVRTLAFQILSMLLLFTFVHKKEDYLIYAGITVISNVGSNILNLIHSRKLLKIGITNKPNIKKHIKPIFVIFASSVATMIYVSSDTTMLGAMCGDYYVGLYSVASKIYGIAKQVMSAMVLVMLPRMALYISSKNSKKYEKASDSLLNTIILFTLPAIVGMICLSKNIIYIISGPEYIEAQFGLQIFSVCLLFSIIAVYLTHVVILPNKLDACLVKATVISALVNIILNWFFIPKYQMDAAAVTTLTSEIIMCIVQIFYARNIYKFRLHKSDTIKVLFGCIAIIIVVDFVNIMVEEFILNTILSIVVGAGIFVVIVFITRHSLIKSILSSISEKLHLRH